MHHLFWLRIDPDSWLFKRKQPLNQGIHLVYFEVFTEVVSGGSLVYFHIVQTEEVFELVFAEEEVHSLDAIEVVEVAAEEIEVAAEHYSSVFAGEEDAAGGCSLV